MKKIFFIGLVLVLMLGLIGCNPFSDDDNVDYNGDTIVWNDYKNSYFTMQYPEGWEYKEYKDYDEYGFDFLVDDNITVRIDFLGTVEEEFIDIVKYELELEDEFRGGMLLEVEKVEINGKETVEVLRESRVINLLSRIEIYLKEAVWGVDDTGITEIEDYLERYDSSLHFIHSITMEELREIKEILKEVLSGNTEDYDSFSVNSAEKILPDIAFLSNLDVIENIYLKDKIVITSTNGMGIAIYFGSLEDEFNDKEELINRIINSIEFNN